jgi:uncharacterized membrane protein
MRIEYRRAYGDLTATVSGGRLLTADPLSASSILDAATTSIRLALDATGLLVIALGGVRAIAALPLAVRGARRFTAVRLDFARYLALALEFQLAADVLETAISPTWDRLGILAAIAAIRTLLNYFLAREMDDERTLIAAEDTTHESRETTVLAHHP